jgi:hypothetical protein
MHGESDLEIKAKLMSRGLMMPGEFLAKKWPKKMAKSGGLDLRPPKPSKKYGGQGPRDPLGDKARAAVSHLMADKGMAALVRYQSKDLVVAGGAACVIGAIISPIFVGADIVNMFGMAGFCESAGGTNTTTPSARSQLGLAVAVRPNTLRACASDAGVSQVGGRISPLFWCASLTSRRNCFIWLTDWASLLCGCRNNYMPRSWEQVCGGHNRGFQPGAAVRAAA